MQTRTGQTMIAYFSGTGYDFDEEGQGYVPQENLDVFIPTPFKNRIKDESFSLVNGFLNKNQIRFGYDGCHHRGGNLFAFGLEEPCNHLYKQIQVFLQEKDEKITLVLTAHSRGCLSAFLLAKKISLDEALKNKIDIILDLRDPVSGNLQLATRLDVARIATIAGELKDLRDCHSIKEVNITIQEKGTVDFGFDVLIPKFPRNRDIHIDFLPGTHDVQEGHQFIHYDSKKNIYRAHRDIFLLGVCRSLQIYSENNAIINYQSVLEFIKIYVSERNEAYALSRDRVVGEIEKHYQERLKINRHYGRTQQHKKILQLALNFGDDFSKQRFELFLKKVQILLYEFLLQEYKSHPERKTYVKALHFGGKYQTLVAVKKATHLNDRHALFRNENPKATKVPFLGFQGDRFDLAKRIKLSNVLISLRNECESYISYLEAKQKNKHGDKIRALKELNALIQVDYFSCGAKIKQLREFEKCFNAQKEIFDEPDNLDLQAKKFKKMITRLLASFISLGGYAIYKAVRSQNHRGYAQFWQPRANRFIGITSEKINKIEKKLAK
jgi:hypothetical protein